MTTTPHDGKVYTWRHTRKGLITGVEILRLVASEWMDVQLFGDHRFGDHNEIVTVRKSFMTLIEGGQR